MKTKDLIEQRARLTAEAIAIRDNPAGDGGALSAEQESRAAAIVAELDALEPKIKTAERLDALDRRAITTTALSAPAEVRAFAHGPAAPVPAGFKGEVWRDREGRAVPVLAREDRMAAFAPADDAASALGFAGYLRALVNGATNDLERRVLGGAAIGTGGAIVPAPLAAGIIDLLRARTAAIQAGARVVPMTSATLAIARQTGDPAGAWRAENAAIAESDPAFDRVNLSAKSWAVRFNVSRELLEDGQNTDAMCRNILAQSAAIGLDRAILTGAGTATEPQGLANVAGLQSVVMAANGAPLAGWAPVLDAVRALELANAGTVSAMIANPRTARAIYGFADSTGQPLQAPPRIATVPTLTTTSLPVNETQGTATDCSSIYLGDFSEVLVGIRTDLQVTVLQERYADVGQIGFMAWMRADVAVARPAALARIRGIRP